MILTQRTDLIYSYENIWRFLTCTKKVEVWQRVVDENDVPSETKTETASLIQSSQANPDVDVSN